MNRFYCLLLIFLLACNSQEDNSDGKNDNLKFSREQLALLKINATEIDFGDVVLDKSIKRYIEVENIGKLPLIFDETQFDGNKFHSSFSYAGGAKSFPGEGGTCQSKLPAGNSCVLAFGFLPVAQKHDSVEISIAYKNGLVTESESFKLKGYGGEEAELSFSVEAIDFPISDQSNYQELTITMQNVGGQLAENFTMDLIPSDEDADMFKIVSSKTTCPSNGTLGIEESCNVVISSTVKVAQIYKDYFGGLNLEYEVDPGNEEKETASLQIYQKVVSIEGELSVPGKEINFGDFVNGHKSFRSFVLQNSGYKDLTLESVIISGDHGHVSIEIDPTQNPCTERDDEHNDISITGKLILAPSQACIMNLSFEPNALSIPVDYSASDIHFTFDDGKNGIRVSSGFSFTADLINPARMEIVGAVDPVFETWNLGNVFVANDTRFAQSQVYTIENKGDVIAENINIELTGSPYFQISHDCPLNLVKDGDCEVTVNFDPLKSVYDANASSINMNSIIAVTYNAGDSDALNIPTVTQTTIQTGGVMNDLPQLYFSDFDTSTSTAREMVAGSSDFFDIKIKNVGANTESSFDLSMTDSTNFFVIDDIALTTVLGVQNCAHIDSGAGSLVSGAECGYRIRSYSVATGDLSSDLTINFQGGAETSAVFTYGITFVNPAKVALAEPLPVTQARIKSYTDFNYPGVGSTTLINAAGVVPTYSTAPNKVPDTMMSFPTIPGTETFDLAYLELGYYAQTIAKKSEYSFTNIGEYEMTITALSLSEVMDVTTSTNVTANGYFSLDSGSGCAPSGSPKAISPNGACTVKMDHTLPNGNLYRAKLTMTYTLGHKINPTSETLQTYTSDITLYAQGYDDSTVAKLSIASPAELVSNGEIEFSAVFGGINTDTDTAVIQNISGMSATDIHYTVLADGQFSDVLDASSKYAITGFAASGPTNYFRLNTSECTGGVQDNISNTEQCDLAVTFTPDSGDEVDRTIIYRYFNGVTYTEDSFVLKGQGLEPALLSVKNLAAIQPGEYSHDFGDSIVEDDHIFYVEVKNQGGVNATNVQLSSTNAPYSLAPSTNGDYEACTATIEADATCYFELVFSPQYSEIEQQVERTLTFDWESGIILTGPVNEAITTTINGDGFVEEKYSQHQGWTDVKLAGFNQQYADDLEAADTRKLNGQFYEAHELGLVSFNWNQMTDEGTHSNAIISYNIYKKSTSDFDIRSDAPYDTVTYDSMAVEYEYIDADLTNVENIPGRVWFYYIVPVRAGNYLSKVDLQNYPAAIIRAVIPESYSIGLHRYTAAMNACKEMDLDVNDVSNIDLTNNGCSYTDANSIAKTFSVNYDTHMDMYEAGDAYATTTLLSINTPGYEAVAEDHSTARTACQAKKVRFTTTEPVINRDLYKDLPNRREHYVFSKKIGGYTQADCQVVDNEIITGDQIDCISDMGLENMAGGLPEWTISQINGYGKGMDTALQPSGVDSSNKGIDYDSLFSGSGNGAKSFTIVDPENPIDQKCFNILTGAFNPLVFGSCGGDNLLNLTSTSGSAGPTTIYLAGTEPINTEFSAFIADDDISGPGGLKIFGIAGGGDELSATESSDNYSPYTTNYTFDFIDTFGFRCSLRVPY